MKLKKIWFKEENYQIREWLTAKNGCTECHEKQGLLSLHMGYVVALLDNVHDASSTSVGCTTT